MQKNILKQQFEGFSVSNSKGLHKGYDRFQSLLSQLEIHGSTASSSSTQNVAFVYENSSSTNDVSTAHDVAMISMRMKKFYKKTRRKLQFDAKEPVGFDKTKVECYNCHKTGHFARECRSKGNQDSRRRDAWNTGNKDKDKGRRSGKQEESKALVTLDIETVQAQTQRFMKIDLDDKTDVLTYHKKLLAEAEKEKEELKAKVEKWHNSSKSLNILLNSQMSARDKVGLGYGDQINKGFLSYENEVFGSLFDSRSSDIEDSLVNNRYAEGMHVVPHLMTGIYIPSGPNKELDDSQFTYGPKQSKPSEYDARSSDFTSCKSNSSEETHESMPESVINKPKVVSQPKVWTDAPIIEEYESDSDDEHDYPQRALKNKGIVDSGCSRHMTGNKAYLAEYQDYNGGPVAFRGSKGYISGKGKIKTGKLDFEDVCFVQELHHFNLFSVSQMCDKKNKVLFTDTECLVLSPDFKLPDENQVLLRVPRQNNMYSFNLENIVPSGGLACLIAKATVDESNKWHRRLGHVNFKNLNKLVKGNLVRGLPSKIFQNDHTCVACQKGKQHKASCKAKSVSSISQPLQLLHMDLFGPTSIPYDTSDLANRFGPNREETMTLANESRSKLNKDYVKPYDYTKQNSLYEIFKAPSLEYLYQLERAKEVRKTMWRKPTHTQQNKQAKKTLPFYRFESNSKQSRQVFNDMTFNINQFREIVDQAWFKHTSDYFRVPTAKDMEVLIKTLLMPLSIKTQNDSFCFEHELKTEMHEDYEYVKSLEKEVDELESEKADFSNIYDLLLEECVSKDVTCSYLHSLSDLNAYAELQCLYLHKVKECECLAQKFSKQTESVNKEDLKAQMQDKNIAISELKKLIEKCKGNPIETCLKNHMLVRTTNAQTIVQLILFIVDSGCTKHMTGNLKLLCNFVEKFLVKQKEAHLSQSCSKFQRKAEFASQTCVSQCRVLEQDTPCIFQRRRHIGTSTFTPRTPEQNCVVERRNRTLVEAA
ncbi:ribonuclease H-like domain-containing protein [Tanacetum coccineum]